MTIYMLLAVVFLEGFVTIAAEILTIRQLIPVVGSNVITTSIIIGIFLLFLAAGYWRGGIHREHLPKILRKNFLYALFFLGIGLSYAFVSLSFNAMQLVFSTNRLFNLMVYLLLIIAPLIYLLGQTVPMTMNLFEQHSSVGKIGGKVLAFSTLGSFLGAVVTSTILMNFFGVAWTVFITVCLLILLVLMMTVHLKTGLIIFFALFSGVVLSYQLNVEFEKLNFQKTTAYANYRVINPITLNNHMQGKLLLINESPSSFLTNGHNAFPYIERIKSILFDDMQLKDKQILVLGAGGFTLTSTGEKGNHVTYVDIDKNLVPIVKKYFNDSLHGRFVSADARQYVHHTTQKYDVIISDAYSDLASMPTYLLTREHFENIRNALTAGGLAIFNIIATPLTDDAYSMRIDNTVRAVFPHCLVEAINHRAQLTNILYICKKETNVDNTVYTDNQSQIVFDYYKDHKRIIK